MSSAQADNVRPFNRRCFICREALGPKTDWVSFIDGATDEWRRGCWTCVWREMDAQRMVWSDDGDSEVRILVEDPDPTDESPF